MNKSDDFPGEDDQRWDRLVDGELSREEYHDLLRSLDRHPDGWRRCALAFLEAQALRQALGQLVGETSLPCHAASLSVRDRGHSRRWPKLVGIAASFLVAFGLGVLYRGGWSGARPDTEGIPVVKDERPESPDPPTPDPEIAETTAPETVPPVEPRRNVRLVVDRPDGSGSEEFELPLYDWSPENEWMLSEDHVRVPPEIRRMLQRMGRELRWDQQLVPLETEDGRRVLIPFRQLEITPVGGQRYQ
jgi:hypothetical protein